MLKKTVTYEDFNGNEVTEDLYFNMTKREIAKLEMSESGGFSEYLKFLSRARKGSEIIDAIEKMVLMAYGQKTPDGRFVKSREVVDAFHYSGAFEKVVEELAYDDEAASAFIIGISPVAISKEDIKEALEASEGV